MRLSYILHLPLDWMLRGLARLPMGVLYFLADLLAWILHYVVRYRRAVVRDNLDKCFPDTDAKERCRVERDFYRNFSDSFVETIKLLHISDDEMRRRMVVENQEYADQLLKSGKSIVAYFSHCINWEWAAALPLWSPLDGDEKVKFGQVYRPLKNEWFDKLLLHIRSRFGNLNFPKHTVLRHLLTLRRDGVASMVGFMSDQKPSHGDPTYVTIFLNRPTAMITGTETLARKLHDAAVYMDIYRLRRGYYKVLVRPMTEDASTLEPMALTRMYTAMLQATIERDPALWLWSHKRWKHPVTLPDSQSLENKDGER